MSIAPHPGPPEAPALEKTTKLSPFASVRRRGRLYNFAKSAARSLELVEHLAAAGEPLRAIDISRAFSWSPSSTHQILRTLVDGGYLLIDPGSKRYHLSPRITGLANAVGHAYFQPGALDRLMGAVHAATGGKVMLCAPQDRFMQVLDVVQPAPAAAGVRKPVDSRGVQSPYVGSCIGAAWLSTQSEAVILRMLGRSRRELGKQAGHEAEHLERIQRVRRQGYAFGGIVADDGIWSVAVPLPPAANGVVLVLAVAAPIETLQARDREVAALVREKIQEILGAP